jgi:aspartate aminotransferase-like enzyme
MGTMKFEEARQVIIQQMKEEGVYDETIRELEVKITAAQKVTADVPGMGIISAWDLAMDMAEHDFNAPEITKALQKLYSYGPGDALVLSANAVGRVMEAKG